MLSSALSTITAAVVGVVLNLAVWFSLHVIFHRVDEHWIGPLRLIVPDPQSVDVASLAIALAAAIAVMRFKLGMIPTLMGAAAIGLIWVTLAGNS